MKKTILLIMLGVWWMVTSAGAQTYFNTRSTNHSFANSYSSVVESNGKFYCTGVALDSMTYQQPGNLYVHTGIRFTVVDKAGTHILDTVFQFPDRNMGAWSNNLRRLADGTFLLGIYDVDTFSGFHQFVVDFDSTGHALWYKELIKTTCGGNANEFWRLEDFQPTGTGEWLMLATEACHQFNNQTDYNLVKLDSAFNIIWEKTYGDPTKNNVGGKLLIDGNSYIISGGYNTANVYPSNVTFKAEIFRMDTTGIVLNHVLVNNLKSTNTIRDIIKTQDGGYAYCGQGAGHEEPNGPMFDYFYFKSWVQKLDAAFNPIWADTFSSYATNTNYNELTRIIEKPNGNLIVSGTITGGFNPGDTLDRNYGVIIQLSSNGDVISKRKYSVPNDTLIYNVYDIKRTSDGGFILAGEAKDTYFPYTYPTQQAWLIKVDSNGCSSINDPQCWSVSVPHNPVITYGQYKVYPNPVSDVLSIAYTNTSGKSAMMQITDAVGRIVLEAPLGGQSGNVQIDVQSLQSGIYLYHIVENGKTVKNGKLTKQ